MEVFFLIKATWRKFWSFYATKSFWGVAVKTCRLECFWLKKVQIN